LGNVKKIKKKKKKDGGRKFSPGGGRGKELGKKW